MSRKQVPIPWSRFAGFEWIPIRVTVRVGRARLSLARLVKLQPGDVVRLDTPVGSSFALAAGDIPLGKVDPVAGEDTVAVKLVTSAEEEDDTSG